VKMIWSTALLLLLAVIAVPSPVRAVDPVAVGTRSGAGSSPLSDLRNDPVKRNELVRYAKGVFLECMSLRPATAPPAWLKDIRRACFVTFFSGKRVVACSGGFRPRTSDLGREIESNIRQALQMDPRARGIDRRTALSVEVLITFPGEPRPVSSYKAIDPNREGLFVESDRFGVAIVPGEAKTASWAYREALRRLGATDPSAVRLFVFDSWAISSIRRK
jgi:hypothetical protein